VKTFLAVLLLIGLATGCSTNDNKAAATPVASPAAAEPAATPAASEADSARMLAAEGKKWLREDMTDRMDGHKTAVFTIWGVEVDPTRYENPAKVEIFCSKTLHSAHFDVGRLASPSVRFKFDDGPVVQQKWEPCRGDLCATLEQQKLIFKGFATSKAVKFEYTPVSKAPKVVVINMADYQYSVLKEPLCKK